MSSLSPRVVTLVLAIGIALTMIVSALLMMTQAITQEYKKTNGTYATQDLPAVQADYEVIYTETGFVPSRLEVPLGAKVIFKNLTQTGLWVGSDPHPEHTDYTDFDALKESNKDQSYMFTFDQTGTFGYHNHKKSIHRGVVVVSDARLETRKLYKTPKGLEHIRDGLIALFDPQDPNTIFTIIDAIQSDQELSLNCHDIAHDLGHRAYELYGFSEAMTFNNPNHVNHPLVQYICAGGYMHGILEELSLHQPEFMQNPDLICDTLPTVERDSCFHGVGHVFMLANERNVEASLNDCRRVEYSTDMYRCFEGIRMEQFWGNTAHVGSDTLGWNVEEPLATCMEAQTDEKPTCFLYVSFGYLREHPKDYFGAVNLCTQSNLSESDSSFCLKGLGITMMSKFNGQHLEGSELYVTGLAPELKYAFYQGVLGYAQLSGVSETVLKQTCALFKVDSELCFSVHTSMKPTFEAYARLTEMQAAQNSNALTTARKFFTLANSRDLLNIEKLFTDTTTYSPQNEGVYFGVTQIMEAFRTFYGEYKTLQWDIVTSKEIRPGVVFFEYVFRGVTTAGKDVDLPGVAYVISSNERVQHIELRPR